MNRLLFIKIPKTASTFFEKNFDKKNIKINEIKYKIISVGHSWIYKTQIKGWGDWNTPNQKLGIYRDLGTFEIKNTDKIVTIVRNPFDLFYSYFNFNWAWCRTYHNLPIDSYTIFDFRKFVDIYLDQSITFHAPAFKKSLFSQLKDKNNKWIINNESIVLKFENLDKEITKFSKLTSANIIDNSDLAKNVASQKKPCKLKDAYLPYQIRTLSKLWEDDLNYFNYEYEK